ncbi:transcriptional regulator [Brevibacillus nitrificans]|uniref:transcriptional regulator n=1 Tax=Brevibacillus nitrificans TaxID=651560 RepID=UPI002858A141|nr:transcriptional regulator [Brevibacillus nitrificans]MDR7318878.1 tetratricopeptide (TPR) repeat protein [Brevibacillus nitrificans]
MTVIQRGIACMVSEAVEKSGLQKNYIANILNIPPAQLSRNLSGSRPFDLKALDSLNELLGLPQGSFYDAYLVDCWNAPRNRGSRIQKLIAHSISNGLPEYAEKMITLLLDGGKELCDLYASALTLETKGYVTEALNLYDTVIKNERNRLAECLALSYYRRFMIVRNWDMDHAFEAATKLGEHITMLPGRHLYEAYIKILTVFYVLDKWDHLLKYCEEVSDVMEGAKQYDIKLYAQCLSYLGISYRHKGKFEQAMEAVHRYASLGDERFIRWGHLNACVVLIEAGQEKKVYELIDLMKKYKDDAPNHLEHVLNYFLSKNEFEEMEDVLETFTAELQVLMSNKDPLGIKRRIIVNCLIAELHIHRNKISKAVPLLMEALEIGKELKLTNQVNNCIRILMRISSQISDEDMATICLTI